MNILTIIIYGRSIKPRIPPPDVGALRNVSLAELL